MVSCDLATSAQADSPGEDRNNGGKDNFFLISTAGKTTPAPAGHSAMLGRTIDTRHGAVSATLLLAARNNHFGESLDVGTFKEKL